MSMPRRRAFAGCSTSGDTWRGHFHSLGFAAGECVEEIRLLVRDVGLGLGGLVPKTVVTQRARHRERADTQAAHIGKRHRGTVWRPWPFGGLIGHFVLLLERPDEPGWCRCR